MLFDGDDAYAAGDVDVDADTDVADADAADDDETVGADCCAWCGALHNAWTQTVL